MSPGTNHDKVLTDDFDEPEAGTAIEATSPLQLRGRKNWMRNKPCPCGSGKKFKRCHWTPRPSDLQPKESA